ncbi:hypothetical protein CDA63_02665 [Hymenobacter amundsenii]|uniref:Glycosyltransferase RgtA/B/C/D-like domain-containing protein n=1 Tax=Hymenobacter amundsenii TaxID=2006685 RepID=A0A246FPK1_9BACT|nr:hypothetical protein [Hymenobacter amundsenii]OWP64681.1 hypothetical protein CDA63_02665 [Hymenobacter amundsenii]
MSRPRSATCLVFLLLTALLASNGYVWLTNHVRFSDEHAYLLLAQGRIGEVSTFHRYRVVVPLLAGALAWGLQSVRQLGGEAGAALGFAFYLLNTLLLALGGTLVYRTARAVGASFGAALGGAVVVLSSGLATYLAGSALVDSLAWLALAALFYALASRHGTLLWWAMVLAPLAKEQLLLLLPVALYYGTFLSWPRRLAAAGLAGAALWLLHYQLDIWYPLPPHNQLTDMSAVVSSHLRNHVVHTLGQLLTVRGLSAVLAVFGLFTLLPVLGLAGGRVARRSWLTRLPPATGAVLACVGGFVLLSGEISRMLFFAGPCFGVAVALLVEYHPAARAFRQWMAATA